LGLRLISKRVACLGAPAELVEQPRLEQQAARIGPDPSRAERPVGALEPVQVAQRSPGNAAAAPSLRQATSASTSRWSSPVSIPGFSRLGSAGVEPVPGGRATCTSGM
jgi:hypothetical protein